MRARLAQATVCNTGYCRTGTLLVRSTHLEFVSVEQVRRVGRHKLDYYAMPSDIVVPPEFVLVHDTEGRVLSRCDMMIVRDKKARVARAQVTQVVLTDAQAYFGDGRPMPIARVDIPKGAWHRVGKVAFIRYRRAGHAQGFYEHEFSHPVDLMVTAGGPVAWRMPLPSGCVVDSRGFVSP
jgi:hypothetical protein